MSQSGKVDVKIEQEDRGHQNEDEQRDQIQADTSTQSLSADRVVQHVNIICPICGSSYESRYDLRVHYEREHDAKKPKDERIFECEDCGKKFKGFHGMRTHKEREHPLFCVLCGKMFYNQAALTKHHEVYHKNN